MPEADEFDNDACAALEFEPLPDESLRRQFDAGPWRKECADAGITLRLAAGLLEKTKPELIEAVHTLGTDGLFELLEHIAEQQDRFTQLADMLKAIEVRLVIAGSAITVENRAEPVRGFGPIL